MQRMLRIPRMSRMPRPTPHPQGGAGETRMPRMPSMALPNPLSQGGRPLGVGEGGGLTTLTITMGGVGGAVQPPPIYSFA